ncbi:MAG: hypothetical protein II939_11745, partial [Bacteroidales bacterium]|nr:hypothetical protein [Bacteroidales bacterium]
MDFTTLDIILIIIAVILIAVVVIIRINTKKYIIRATRRIDDHYASLLNKSYNENRRINTLYNELKTQSAAQKSTRKNANSSQILQVERIAAEQVNLQAQQDELASRNRQLWDMSVTIEKERQHIQSLKTEIEAQHHSVTSSIRYAKQIQTAALPSEDVLNNAFKDFFLFWRPREIVSGDFYWMKRLGNNLIFTIADCTGHGVPGGFMSMLAVAFLNDICVDFTLETTPAHILEQLRSKVIVTLKHPDDDHVVQKDGIDMGICILNLDSNKMQFAGANNG